MSLSNTNGAIHMKVFISIISSLLLVTSCAIVPEPIDVADNVSLTAFEQVTPNKSNAQLIGTNARWGGKIVAVTNKKDVSEIEIVYFPENHFGKPRTGEESAGRFKAIVEGFIDPMVFKTERLITVVGEIGEPNTALIGEQEYEYPTLNAVGYYMWKETSEVDVDAFAFAPFGFHARYRRNYFSPWYDPFYHSRNRVRVRVTHNNGHTQGGRVEKPIERSSSESGAGNRSRKEPVQRK